MDYHKEYQKILDRIKESPDYEMISENLRQIREYNEVNGSKLDIASDISNDGTEV